MEQPSDSEHEGRRPTTRLPRQEQPDLVQQPGREERAQRAEVRDEVQDAGPVQRAEVRNAVQDAGPVQAGAPADSKARPREMQPKAGPPAGLHERTRPLRAPNFPDTRIA